MQKQLGEYIPSCFLFNLSIKITYFDSLQQPFFICIIVQKNSIIICHIIYRVKKMSFNE